VKIQIWTLQTFFTQVLSKQFTLRPNYVLVHSSAPIGWSFVKIHIWDDAHVPYTALKFRLDRAITKGTLLVEQSPFSSMSRLQVERFSCILISGFLGSQNISSVEMGH
jgi:hypothetical protein